MITQPKFPIKIKMIWSWHFLPKREYAFERCVKTEWLLPFAREMFSGLRTPLF